MMDGVNRYFADPTQAVFDEVFLPNAFIRLNSVYLHPTAFRDIQNQFLQFDLKEVRLEIDGLKFVFDTFETLFKGHLKIFKDTKEPVLTGESAADNTDEFEIDDATGRIYSVELDFNVEPETEKESMFLNELQAYFERHDAIFFTTQPFDYDAAVLELPLEDMLELLAEVNPDFKQ